MKSLNWDGVYASVPQNVHTKLEQALEDKNKMNAKKAIKPMTAVALALLLALTLGGAAYAATHTDILYYLVGGEDKASQELKNSVQAVSGEASADGFQIEVTGAVFDGERLAVSYSVLNTAPDTPAMIALDQVLLEGEWTPVEFSGGGGWMPLFLGETRGVAAPDAQGFMSMPLKKAYAGEVRGEMVFLVSRPTGPIAVVDPSVWYDYERALPNEEARADAIARQEMIFASPVEVADIYRLHPEDWYLRGYTVVDAYGNFPLDDMQYREYLVPEDFGAIPGQHMAETYPTQMETTAEIHVSFTFDADRAADNRKTGFMADVSLPDCTLRLEKCVVTPLSTLMELRFYPLENTREAASLLTSRYGSPAMTDQDGNLLNLDAMEGEGGFGGVSQDENGLWYTSLESLWGGVSPAPREIRFSYAYPDAFPFVAPDDPIEENLRSLEEEAVIWLE